MSVDLDTFKKNYLVVGLGDEAVKEIAGLATVETFVAGDDIIRQSEKDRDLFVILAGRVNILTSTGDKLAEIGPGGVLGEIALIDDQPRSANAVCIGQVQAARVPAKEFRALMNKNRDMGFVVLANLARVLCMRLRSASIRLDHLMNQDTWKGSL